MIYHVLCLLLTLNQVTGLIVSSSLSGLTGETHDDIVMMIENWIQRNKNPSLGERVYHINMDSNGDAAHLDDSYGKRFYTPSSENDKPPPPPLPPRPPRPLRPLRPDLISKFPIDTRPKRRKPKRKWVKYQRPNRLHGFKYYGQLGELGPEFFDPNLVVPGNDKLQWKDLIGTNLQTQKLYSGLLENQLGSLLEDQSSGQLSFPFVQGNRLYNDLFNEKYNYIKGNYDHPPPPPPPEPPKPDKHEHKHEHNHEHKHHYHVTKTKKEHIHHVTVPVPYPIHIKVHRHYKHHQHHDSKNNYNNIAPFAIAAAVGLPLLLGALLLPLALLFLTTIATLLAALAGGNGIFGGNGATLIPVTAATTSGGRLKRSATSEWIHDEQKLDSLYNFIMGCIYSMGTQLSSDSISRSFDQLIY